MFGGNMWTKVTKFAIGIGGILALLGVLFSAYSEIPTKSQVEAQYTAIRDFEEVKLQVTENKTRLDFKIDTDQIVALEQEQWRLEKKYNSREPLVMDEIDSQRYKTIINEINRLRLKWGR